MEQTPERLEQDFVHSVYNAIAPHFSTTRYKPWPVVDDFLKTRQSSSIGADIGCGNGKYINVNPALFIIGCDRSDGLISICHSRGYEAFLCDAAIIPYRNQCFDFVLSIAVIHHFSTPDRRLHAVQELLRISAGEVLIFVWAFEQTKHSKRLFDKQDNLVPWKVPKSMQDLANRESQFEFKKLDAACADQDGDIIYQRFYHLFHEGELEDLVTGAGGIVVRKGYDQDNWWCVAKSGVR